MRRTKIVATVGPASEAPEVLRRLVQAGADLFRINCSHGSADDHRRMAAAIRSVAEELNYPVGILWDLQGPRLRVGTLNEPILLEPGQDIVLCHVEETGDRPFLPVEVPYIATAVRPGQRILLDDGRIELETVHTDGIRVRARVIRGGLVKSRKGINLPGARLAVPILSEEDLRDLHTGVEAGADFICLSFVRSAEDVETLRTAVQAHGADIPIIAKLERPEAIDRLDQILACADGVMVARGDLGVEMPPEEVPVLQKQIISKANRAFVPVITATQMLESMMESPRPTRAEASDVANAVLDGTDAVMLSGETAVGRFPVEAVSIMDRIIAKAEEHLSPEPSVYQGPPESDVAVAHAIADAACVASEDLPVKAIAVFTQTGSTALFVSKRRPTAPIIGFTPEERIRRRMTLLWGVLPLCLPFTESTDHLLAMMEEQLLNRKLVVKGDWVVIVAGIPLSIRGRANFLKVHRIGTA
ncbi:MAG: pyruvate kinase [Armatimonadetes bacterium]|nr:pyruvate kinase [Armatimonadota bacterium]MDW8121388.1 pyruvate kinase [Armatimonadota bacterium]